MFSWSGLTSTPYISANTVAPYAYNQMFWTCRNLTQSLGLSAANYAASNGMRQMYRACSALTAIATNITAWGNNSSWVDGVAATGNFYCPAALPQTYGTSNIPTGWTVYDITADTDEDGFTDAEENEAGSDPDNAGSIPSDRDGDGYPNDDEESEGTDPDDPDDYPGSSGDDSADDTDGDGWANIDEEMRGTDPNDPNESPDTVDADEDGYSDGDEINNGTDPDDPTDYPGSGGDEPEPEEEPEE